MTQLVRVIGGTGRWAYWASRERGEVVADHICQERLPHFAGMFDVPVAESGEYEMKVGAVLPERPSSIFVEDFEE